MKKGFTLVEILAVIVILGIIALITMPAITKIIDGSRADTFRISLESLLKVAKNDYQGNARIDEVTYTLKNNTLTCTRGCTEGVINIKYSGDLKDAAGTIKITNDDIEINIKNNVYKGTYEQRNDEEKGLIGKVVVNKVEN